VPKEKWRHIISGAYLILASGGARESERRPKLRYLFILVREYTTSVRMCGAVAYALADKAAESGGAHSVYTGGD